jgi:hypothetical protein
MEQVRKFLNGDGRRKRDEGVQVRTALPASIIQVVKADKRGQPLRIVRATAPAFEKMSVQKIDDANGRLRWLALR